MDKYNNPQPYQNAAKIKKAAEAAEAEKAEAKKSGDPSQHTTATNNNQ